MSIQNRLKKLETSGVNDEQCFCGKTLLDVFYGEPGLFGLTACPKCQKNYEIWMRLYKEAENLNNATDNEH